MTRLGRVIIDLTPVMPGARNGGVKVMARTLVRELGVLAPSTEFTLLTAGLTDSELGDLDAPNVRRECVFPNVTPKNPRTLVLAGARTVVDAAANALPGGIGTKIRDAAWSLARRGHSTALARGVRPDLMLCPFTGPTFYDASVPLITVVHDVQFLQHPEFFQPDDLAARQRNFDEACRYADRLICDSDFVRAAVLAASDLPSDRVHTIHLGTLHAADPDPQWEARGRGVLERLGVRRRRYLLYPANPWPHKNHRLLLEAFALFRGRSPGADLALICTGEPSAATAQLDRLATSLLSPGDFAFAGFLDEREYAALLRGCRALVYPSLYEGFGMPLLEAMACDRPVLCSDAASLPEVAGDAALLFDARDPEALVNALDRLESEPGLEATLIQRGRQRVAHFGTAHDVAARYLVSFEAVLRARAS